MGLRIGIDLGGTKIEIVGLAADGRELLRRRIATPQGDYRATLTAIAGLVAEAEAELGQTGSVGIGIPGAESLRSGLIKNANSTCLIGQPLRHDLQTLLRREVRLANDANCFALSEAIDGAGRDVETVFGVILGTGVGGGIVIRRQVLVGANAIAGEWGHNPLPSPDIHEMAGRPCFCGQRGCIESWVSGRGFEADYAAHTGQALKAGAILELKRAGDHVAAVLWGRYIDRLARGLAVVVNSLDPDVFVMGGGMSNIDELYDDLPPALAARIFSPVLHTPILRPRFGDASGARGAARLWA